MRDFLRFCLTMVRVNRMIFVALIVSTALVLPAVYVVGLVNQPELISYVDDGLFYGVYLYDLSTVRLVSGVIALGLVLLFSCGSFGGFLGTSRGTLMLTLPVSRGAKFACVAVFDFVLMPFVIGALLVGNDWIWSVALDVEPIVDMLQSNHFVLNYVAMFAALNAVSFYFGVRFARYQWAYCLGFLLVVGTGIYYASSLMTYAPDSLNYTDGAFTLVCVTFTLGLIVLAAIRFCKIEIRG